MNKVWEIVEKEAREGSAGRRTGYRMGMRSDDHKYRSYKQDDDVREAYDCGYDDGYSDAMKKIFGILRNAE